jgi:hypothetical protein
MKSNLLRTMLKFFTFLCLMAQGISEIKGICPGGDFTGKPAKIADGHHGATIPFLNLRMSLNGGCQDSAAATTASMDGIDASADEGIAAQREARKKAKQEEKLAKKNAKLSAAAAAVSSVRSSSSLDPVAHQPLVRFNGSQWPSELYGDLEMPRSDTKRKFHTLDEIGEGQHHGHGARVWVRGRVQQVRAKGNSAFLVLRKGFATIQVNSSIRRVTIPFHLHVCPSA